MKLPAGEPPFLVIRWEAPQAGGDRVITLEAALCRLHRNEIALQHPNARGFKRFGLSCDLCQGRRPKSV